MPGTSAPLLAAAHQSLKGTVGSFVYQGKTYVAKRLLAKKPLPFETVLLNWVSHKLAGRPCRKADLPAGADYELRRLQALAQAGVKVPPVLAFDAELMVLAHCGTDAFNAMRRMPRAERTSFLIRLAQELAEFHQTGHWHGGAQIKNILVQDQQTWRIDFEEAALERLPLPLAQAYDLLLFLNVLPLAGPIDEEESCLLLPALLLTYFTRHPSTEVRQCLTRMLPWARRLRWIARPFHRLSRKSIRRAEILIDCLEHFLSSQPDA